MKRFLNSSAGGEGRGRKGRESWGEGWGGAREKPRETAIYPFMEDREQRADGDTLVHEAGLLQALEQAHSHQL